MTRLVALIVLAASLAHAVPMGARQATWGGSPLPYDSEVEWIENAAQNRQNYFDTGYIPTSKCRMELKFRLTKDETNTSKLNKIGRDASGGANGRFAVGFMRGRVYFGLANINKDINVSLSPYNNDYEIFLDAASNTAGYNGVRVSITSNSLECNASLLVFCGAYSTAAGRVTSSQAYGRLYYMRIYDNGNLVMDIRPVRVGTDGFLFDAVSGRLLPKYGENAFLVGPDK